MLSRDTLAPGGWVRLGPGAVALILAALLFYAGPVPQRAESWYYDWLQRQQDRPASARIVLVDSAGLPDADRGIWSAPELPALLRALRAAGAALIVPVQAPPGDALLPDTEQLIALANLEQRRRHVGANPPAASADSRVPDAFAAQLANMQQQADRQRRLVETVAAGNDVVLALHSGNRQATGAAAESCFAHSVPALGNARLPDPRWVRPVRGMAFPVDALCRASRGAGHLEFWRDADGVVRRTDLLVGTGGRTFAALALAAALVSGTSPEAGFSRGSTSTVDPGATLPTAIQGKLLHRFYPEAAEGAVFTIIQARDLLADTAPAGQIAGRIAIVGDLRGTDGALYATPVDEQASDLLMVATGISNLLENDYLVRPSWLSWIETTLLVLIGGILLGWGWRVAPAVAVMCGVIAAGALLAVEAWLLIGAAGVWSELVGPALFTIVGVGTVRLWQPRPAVARTAAPDAPEPDRAVASSPSLSEELDLAFSALRQQPASPAVKQRLYDIALEHARRRDLARAERVLRHLATLDPAFRGVGEKLNRLAGLRSGNGTRSAAPPPSSMPAPVSAPGAELTLGRYSLEQIIGRGAMATVYLGRDPTINRKVAVKTIALAQEFGDGDLANARAQFIREAESAGRLNHPGIITIYDVGEDGQTAYLAMEYFPGRSLSHYAQQGRLLPAARVFDLMARAAEALHYAHGQHVVHRDIKPANLLYDERSDTLKITDFGIARLTDTSRTKTGIILGTPSYMSPEQLAGQGVTGQSDLFSLGVTTYQLLAGMPPFRADSIPRLMQKIAHERHEPLSRLRDDLPSAVDQLLDRALAKDPADRFASGREMALALRDCCSTLPMVPVARTA